MNNLSSTDSNFVCNGAFEGGGWLQVRHKAFNSPKWHLATDGLRGLDVYGYPGLDEYSIYFADKLKRETELLFVLGMKAFAPIFLTLSTSILSSPPKQTCMLLSLGALKNACCFASSAGNFNHWLITTWGQIDNSAGLFWNQDRTVLKSSTSSSSCTMLFLSNSLVA